MKKRVKEMIQGVMGFVHKRVKYKVEVDEKGVHKCELKFVPDNDGADSKLFIKELEKK